MLFIFIVIRFSIFSSLFSLFFPSDEQTIEKDLNLGWNQQEVSHLLLTSQIPINLSEYINIYQYNQATKLYEHTLGDVLRLLHHYFKHYFISNK